MPDDPHDLNRFLEAQRTVYTSALAELTGGRKYGHWMWFIFPQVVGLGFSPMAELYAIKSLQEARAYLAHHVLGPRLRECASALLGVTGSSSRQILGSTDDLKLRSSMTLFTEVDGPGTQFSQVLDRYYDGEPDPLTTEVLQRWRRAEPPDSW